MISLEKMFFTTHLFLDLSIKYLFLNTDNYTSFLLILQMAKISMYPKDHLLQLEIWLSATGKLYILLFHNAMIPQNVMHL